MSIDCIVEEDHSVALQVRSTVRVWSEGVGVDRGCCVDTGATECIGAGTSDQAHSGGMLMSHVSVLYLYTNCVACIQVYTVYATMYVRNTLP